MLWFIAEIVGEGAAGQAYLNTSYVMVHQGNHRQNRDHF